MNAMSEAIHCEMLTEDKSFYDREYEILTLGHNDYVPFNYSIMKKSMLTEKDEPIYGYRCLFAKSEGILYKIAMTSNHEDKMYGISVRPVKKIKKDDLMLISAMRHQNTITFCYTDDFLANYFVHPLDTVDSSDKIHPFFTNVYRALFKGHISDLDMEYVELMLEDFDGYLDEKLEKEIRDAIEKCKSNK